MKFSLPVLAAVVGLATAADQAIVINDCSIPVYVQSFPYNGGDAGPLTKLNPGDRYTEDQKASGSVRFSS